MLLFSRTIRYTALSLIGLASLCLVLGALLYQAAFVTGANSDYSVSVSWSSAFASVLWPPTRLPFLLLLAAFSWSALAYYLFFRVRRGIAATLFFLQAGVVFFEWGWVGWFFIRCELEEYHFNMFAEKLGENWFVWQAVGWWTLVVTALGMVKIFAREIGPNSNGAQ